jgi:hypothetical protein
MTPVTVQCCHPKTLPYLNAALPGLVGCSQTSSKKTLHHPHAGAISHKLTCQTPETNQKFRLQQHPTINIMPEPDNTIITRTVRNGREFATRADGTSWTRKLDRATNKPITDWTPVESPPTTTTPSSPSKTTTTTRRFLSVVAEHQTTNEAKHWSLFSHALPPNAPTDTAPGQVWQVKGDAELMHHDRT